MKKLLTGVAAAALILSSCAKNDLIDAPSSGQNDGKIRFSGTTGLVASKAATDNPFNSTADLQQLGFFQVKGYSDNDLLVDATATNAVKWTGGVSWEYSNEPYWPNGSMDFIAYANWPGTGTKTSPAESQNLTIDKDGISSDEIEIKQDATEAHSDFLVAVTKGATKQVRTLLTFKHALTQVVFKAGNIKPTELEVFINSVEIVNVANKGSMKKYDGTGKIEWIATPGNSLAYNVDKINNSTALNEATSYKVDNIADADKTTYSKYPRIQSDVEPANNALMLIPQTFTAWDPNGGSNATEDNGTIGKAYIRIGAVIRKPLDATYTAHDAKYLYLGDATGATLDKPNFEYLYIPVESQDNQVGKWEAGKRINYIITFGDKNSGSGGGGYDENGDPILVPIRFRAVVEDWVESNVPLLSATFSASSTQIDGPFVNGYLNQLLNDIKAAPAAKVFRSLITLTGSVSNNPGFKANIMADATSTATDFTQNINSLVTPTVQLNSKFRPGSTITAQFGEIASNVSVTPSAINTLQFTVPSGWKATYKGTEYPSIATTKDITVTSTIADEDNTVLFTKLPVSGYNYTCSPFYIEDVIGTIELNENGAAFGAPSITAGTNTILVTGTLADNKTYGFSAELLSKLDARFEGWEVVIDMSHTTGITFGTGSKITTTIPAGWSATLSTNAGITYNTGDIVEVTAKGVLTFTKLATGVGSSWLKLAALNLVLPAASATVEEQFLFDNVDYNVSLSTALFTGATETCVIKLRYPLTYSALTVGTNWTAHKADGSATTTAGDMVATLKYTKPTP